MNDKEKTITEFKREGVRLLTLKQTMRFLSVQDYKTLYKILKAENIPIITMGDSDRVDINDLESLIEEKKRMPMAS